MNKRSQILILLVVIIALLSFACSFGNRSNTQPETALPPTTAAEDTPQPSADLNSADLPVLGDRVEITEGGFALNSPEGYVVEVNGGSISMLAPGADADSGPVIEAIGMYSEPETSAQEMLEQLRSGSDLSIGKVSEVAIAGETGLMVELGGGESAANQQGQIFLVVLGGHQQFMLLGGAPISDWQNFFPVVQAVAASVQFSELATPVLFSTMPSGNYPYTNRNVIRGLAEKDGVLYAATLGGLTAWDVTTNSVLDIVPMQGMGHISANAVVYCEIPEPRILVGTLEGISIFDPASGVWEQRDLLPAEDYVSRAKIDRLYCDQANQRLLIGYSGLGILDLTSGNFRQITDKDGLLWNAVSDITVHGSDIWIASGYKGIAKISNDQVTVYSEAEGMPDETAYALEFSEDGTLWVGASSGMISYKAGVWQLFGSDSSAKISSISEIEPASANTFWVSTAPFGSGRLCLFNTATAVCEEEYTDPNGEPVIALAATATGAAYGNDEGITLINDGALIPLDTGDQLVSNFVDFLTLAPDGSLWVGTDNGVQVLDPSDPDQAWVTYQRNDQEGMGGNWTPSISFAPDGAVWLVMINGSLSRFQAGQWTNFPDLYSYYTAVVDSQNRVWVADDGNGIVVLDDQGSPLMSFTTENGLPSDNVQALQVDAYGTVWIGTSQGLVKYENGQLITVFGPENKDLPNVYIRALTLDAGGNLLIGTYTGVAAFDGTTLTTLLDFIKDGYNDQRLTTLAAAPDGEIWIGTDEGLLHGNLQSGWTLIDTKNHLLSNYISALTVDQYGSVWVGGGGSNFDGGGLLHIVP